MYFFSLLFWAMSYLASAQSTIEEAADQKVFDNQKNKLLSTVIRSTLQSAHYQAREFNDDFSADFFDEYLSSIDRTKKFLLQEDVDLLKEYRFD